MARNALTSLPGTPAAVAAPVTPARRLAGTTNTSIETPVKKYLAASASGTPQVISPLNKLIFDLLNPNASAKGADKASAEADEQFQAYLRKRLLAHQTFVSIPILEYIHDYAGNMMAEADALYRCGGAFAKELLAQQGALETDTDGKYQYTPTIKLPQGEDQEATAVHMQDLYIALHNRLFRNTAIALQVIEETVPSTRIDRSAASAPVSAKKTTKIPPKKLSPWKKFKRNWKQMHTGWKVAAGVIIALCIVGVVAAAILCPPSLAFTVPIAGKLTVATLAMGAAATIATSTAVGHSIHIVRATPKETIDLSDLEPTNESAVATSKLPQQTQEDIQAAIEKTVTDIIVANTNCVLEARAEDPQAVARTQRAQQRAAAPASPPPDSGRLTPTAGTPDLKEVRAALLFNTPKRKGTPVNSGTSTVSPGNAGYCN